MIYALIPGDWKTNREIDTNEECVKRSFIKLNKLDLSWI